MIENEWVNRLCAAIRLMGRNTLLIVAKAIAERFDELEQESPDTAA